MKFLRLAPVALSIALVAATATTALADPAEPANASCVGIEAAAISPPGSSDEPGAEQGIPEIVHFIRDTLGLQVGQVASRIAKVHAETHEACDEALEEIIGDLLD